MNFPVIPKPPTKGDERENYRWQYIVCEVLNGLRAIFLEHDKTKGLLIADPTHTDTDGYKHVTDAQTNKWETHVDIINGNPHGTDHAQLDAIQVLDPTSTGTIQDRHLSDAQGKVWQDHVEIVDGNPHGTDHSQLDAIGTLDVTSTDTPQDKHLSNADGKKWEDHVDITDGNPHGTDHSMLDNIVQADDTSSNTDGGKHVTDAQLKVYKDFKVLTVQQWDDVKDPTGWVDPLLINVAYNSAADTVTLTGTLDYYWRGVKKSLTSPWTSTPHPAGVTGYFLSSSDGINFTWSTTPWAFSSLMVAFIQHGAVDLFGVRECHSTMPWTAHEEFHRVNGTYRESGGTLAGYVLASTTAANRRPSVAATVVHDEDIQTTLPALADNGPYTQHFLTTTGVSNFTLSAAEITPVLVHNPYFNSFTTPNWTQTLMANNSYMCVWLVAIPVTSDAVSQAYRYIWLQGQTNGNLAGQQALFPQDLNLGQLTTMSPEFIFTAKVIIRYTGGNWDFHSVTDLTGTRALSVGSPSGTFLSTVTTDTTLTGDGTALAPLGLNPATPITSTVATGTAPFVVTSTTEVANLNAHAVGGATYATGTWTPSFKSYSGAFATLTYTTQTGLYTRIGSLVVAKFTLVVNAVSVGTAATILGLNLTGLPSGAFLGGTITDRNSFATVAPDQISSGAYLFHNTTTGYTFQAPSTLQAGTNLEGIVFIFA